MPVVVAGIPPPSLLLLHFWCKTDANRQKYGPHVRECGVVFLQITKNPLFYVVKKMD